MLIFNSGNPEQWIISLSIFSKIRYILPLQLSKNENKCTYLFYILGNKKLTIDLWRSITQNNYIYCGLPNKRNADNEAPVLGEHLGISEYEIFKHRIGKNVVKTTAVASSQ